MWVISTASQHPVLRSQQRQVGIGKTPCASLISILSPKNIRLLYSRCRVLSSTAVCHPTESTSHIPPSTSHIMGEPLGACTEPWCAGGSSPAEEPRWALRHQPFRKLIKVSLPPRNGVIKLSETHQELGPTNKYPSHRDASSTMTCLCAYNQTLHL